jgi:putative chitinase
MQIRVDQQLIRRVLIGYSTPSDEVLNAFVASFGMWNETFAINTPLRIAAYLSQVLHESAFLSAKTENLNYSADGLLKTWPKRFDRAKAEAYARQPEKIANYVYANRMGNGDEASGDGWRYRGRGLIQITGKENYAAFSKFDLCTEPVLKNPDKVATYPIDQIAAMWYWEKKKINEPADRGDTTEVTKRVNGGTNGLAQRNVIYRRLICEFGIKKL